MRPQQQGQRGLVSVGAAGPALSVPPQSASGSGTAMENLGDLQRRAAHRRPVIRPASPGPAS
jgi:hypothetical protein